MTKPLEKIGRARGVRGVEGLSLSLNVKVNHGSAPLSSCAAVLIDCRFGQSTSRYHIIV
jgi:hypothetical protein